ncbi:MAG: hypothetical protein Q8P40_16025 [Nitrospirota bacterium]|jgi:hypothetical protein|nr:hypothetical protein [Nitrospirota bacterium]
METTTVRVRKQSREKLKKISGTEKISVIELIDKLINEHEKSFWKGFNDEAKAYLDKEESKLRKTFERVSKDGFSK